MTHSSHTKGAEVGSSAPSYGYGVRPSFSQVLLIFLRRWYWFVLSIALFVWLGSSIVKYRPLGRQTYYMQLSSREPHELTEPTMQLSDSAFRTSPWAPEYIASLLNTTTAVLEAGKRIDFQVDYWVKTPFGMRDYYNQTPIIVRFGNLLPTDKVDCIARLDDPVHPRQVTLSGFAGVVQGQPLYEPYDVVIPVGTTQETPVGPVTVTLDDPTQHFPYHIDQRYTEVAITYTSLVVARDVYETEMQVTMKKADLPLSSVMRVELLSNRSERRCLSLLNEMYIVTDSLGWVEQLSDEGQVDSLGQFVGTVPPAGLSPFKLIDKPRELREIEPDLFVIAGMGLLGLLLPLFLMYIYWAVLGVIHYLSELPTLLRERLTLDLKRARWGRRPLYPNLEELATALAPQGEQRTVLLATPDRVKAHSQLVCELQQALQQRGVSCGVWSLDLPSKKMTDKPQKAVCHTQLTPGLIGSTAFQQQMQQLQTQYQLLIIVPPALAQDPLAYSLSERVEQSYCAIYREATRIRSIRRVVKQMEVRQQLNLSKWHTLWID